MLYEFGNFSVLAPFWIVIVICSIMAFTITSIAIPSIIKVSRDKHLFDTPNQRTSHTAAIPTLGGAAVFLGMMVPMAFFGGWQFAYELKFIFIGLLILFFIGIKDDILDISARSKLIAEILAICIVVIMGDLRVSNFHGFLGINELPYFVSILFTMFMFIVIINGYNLIDGIDGLASGVGILSLTIFAFWFLMIGDQPFATFCFSIASALLAFFRLNVFGTRNKIFLGDTGSLIIGMILTIVSVRFLELSLTKKAGAVDLASPALAIAILIVPLIDTARVFTLRILVGKSPFRPDRFHSHHKLLLLGFTHLQATMLILAYNVIIIVIAFSLRFNGNIKLLLVILPASILFTSIPGLIFRFKVRRFTTQLGMLGKHSWILPITFTNLIINYFPKISYIRSSFLPSPEDQVQTNRDLDLELYQAYLRYGNKEGGFEKN